MGLSFEEHHVAARFHQFIRGAEARQPSPDDHDPGHFGDTAAHETKLYAKYAPSTKDNFRLIPANSAARDVLWVRA